jgi:hypothetical protein
MMRRRMRTGRLIVERTRRLRAALRVRTTRRHTQEPKGNSHGMHSRARSAGAQNPLLGVF